MAIKCTLDTVSEQETAYLQKKKKPYQFCSESSGVSLLALFRECEWVTHMDTYHIRSSGRDLLFSFLYFKGKHKSLNRGSANELLKMLCECQHPSLLKHGAEWDAFSFLQKKNILFLLCTFHDNFLLLN